MIDALDTSIVEAPSFLAAADALCLGVAFQLLAGPGPGRARFVYVGAACEEMFGLAPDLLLADARLLSDLIAPDDRERLEEAKEEALASGGKCDVTVSMRTTDGAAAWRRIVSSPKQMADGAVLWTGLITDVSDARRMSRRLLAEQQRLQLALDVSGVGVFQWDRSSPDTIIWSPRIYELIGVPQGQPITLEQSLGFVHPDDRARVQAGLGGAFSDGDGRDFTTEYRIVRPDGELRWILCRGRMIRDADGARTLHGTSLDITERKLAEEQRQLQMRELAHRGKNALSVMMAMVRQAARAGGSADDLAAVLLARLGALAKSQDLAMASDGRAVEMSQLMAQVLAPFDLRRFQVEPAAGLVTAEGETASGLALLLHELATNAVKYGALSSPGGRVRISAEPAENGSAVLVWRERGGPSVSPPQQHGFGLRVIETALRSVNGSVTPSYDPEGFAARIVFPAG